MTEYWKVPRLWDNEICAVLGAGPSMSSLDVAAIRDAGLKTIAVNNQGIPCRDSSGVLTALAPWADILYASDRLWWHNNKEAAERFAGLRVTVAENGFGQFVPVIEDTQVLGNGGASGFDDRSTHIRTGRNSGYAAMHLAAHLGARMILLFGFEMNDSKGMHWHQDHSWRKNYRSRYELFIREFEIGAPEFARREIIVINCTPDSALECFSSMTFEKAMWYGMLNLRKGKKATAKSCERETRIAGTSADTSNAEAQKG